VTAQLGTDGFDVRDLLPDAPAPRWAKVIDHERCIGCHACTTACRSENEVPLSVTRTYVKYVDVGTYPQARRAFQVTRCNQCEDAPCVTACPTAAMYRRPDGIVDFDKSACIGCKACIAACPYDAIFINPEDHSAEKCNFCAHRLEVGLEPACVVVCPTGAILVGDLEDPGSEVARIVHREPVTVRRPEKETRPKLFYRGAHQATLDPLAARRPDGGLFMWSEQGDVAHQVPSGVPAPHNSSAAAVLAYDVPHRAPWDWRVSLYTWTKGIAAGAYLVALALALAGALSWSDELWRWQAPLLALVALAATGAVLVWDLEHPARFHYIFTRPQWRSWLVRGAVVLTGYGAVLVAHLIGVPARALAVAGAPLAAATAAYTAYLFAQARARDLWQSPLLPGHLLVQAALAGAAALMLLGGPDELEWVLAAAALAHLVLAAGEASVGHPTAHARLAAREMTRGRYAWAFWSGLALVAVALAAPWLGAAVAVPALLGLLAHEHAYVQAGQAVPLA
jgi:Fe-S-cluster-containing dehydrogenase component/formate-dependent nitrite reductase membrane component NrfD